MIDFTVIGGYLGAGKTTLLNHLLRHNDGLRIAILINDFGAINIDGDLIESQQDNQINLTNGCVCCTLTDGFFEAVEALQQLQPPPDHIVVEASGVADVAALSQYGNLPGLQLAGVLVVADAETVRTKADDKYVAQTVRRQLAAADVIVINKTDLVTGDTTHELREWLSNVSQAQLIEAQHARVPTAILLGSYQRDARPTGHGHEQYATWHTSSGVLDPGQSRKFVDALSGLPVLRAKGLLPLSDGSVLEIQKVGQRTDSRVFTDRHRESGDFVAIDLADQLDTDALAELVEQYLRD